MSAQTGSGFDGNGGVTSMSEVSPKVIRHVRTLAQIAAELRQGKDFNITRLTLLKRAVGQVIRPGSVPIVV